MYQCVVLFGFKLLFNSVLIDFIESGKAHHFHYIFL